MSSEPLLDALDPEQRTVATTLRGPVRVLAGAGTGKTRAITHRIAYGIQVGAYRPGNVLAVTFTARAAGEMRTRLRLLGASGVQARTFHAAALRQLGFFWPKVVGGAAAADPREEGCRSSRTPRSWSASRPTGRASATWPPRSSGPRSRSSRPDDYEKAAAATDRPAPGGIDPQSVARLMTAYETAKDQQGVIDFEDVLLLLAAMLAERRDVADSVREQYRYFVVDEYQDVSPLQQYLLDQWLGGRDELCVVGDPSQTIYSFAGATAHHLTAFTASYPRADDHRAGPRLPVDAAGGRPGQPPDAQRARRPGGARPARAAPRRPGRLVRRPTPTTTRRRPASPPGSPRLIRSGVPAARDRRPVPDQRAVGGVRGGARGPGDRLPGARQRPLLRPRRRAQGAGAAARRRPQRGPGRADAGGRAGHPALGRAGPRSAPEGRGASRERWDALQALVALADSLAAAPPTGAPPTVADLVAELDERAAAQHAPTVEGVTLASLHAAKGLEWEAVFLVGLSEGLLPTVAGADRRPPSRRSAACSTSASPAPASTSSCRTRGPATRGPARRAACRASSRTCGRASAARVAGAHRRSPTAAAWSSRLTRWRDARAAELRRQPGVGADDGDRSARSRSADPATLEELGQVRGVGPTAARGRRRAGSRGAAGARAPLSRTGDGRNSSKNSR